MIAANLPSWQLQHINISTICLIPMLLLQLSDKDSYYPDWQGQSMGNAYLTAKRRIFKTPAKVVLIGQYGSGKTTALFKLKRGEIGTATTIGFNMEEVELGGCRMELWDFSGSIHMRRLWEHYFDDCEGVVFFIDLSQNDQDYNDASRIILEAMLKIRQVQQVPLLIVGNKKDIAVMDLDDAVARHHLERFRVPVLKIVQTCSTSGEGLKEGFEWLGSEILKKR